MHTLLARLLTCLAVTALVVPAAADARRAPKPPKHYEVGMADRSISLDANGTWKGAPVYLGGYGLGNGQALGSVAGQPNPQGGLQYASGRAADGNLADGLHVRAVTISAGHERFAMADIENQGCFVQNKQGFGLLPMRQAASAATGIPADRIFIQCDHSHGGPDLIGAWGGVPTGYLSFVKDQTVAAIVDAYAHQRSANLWYGTAQSGVAGRDPDSSDPLLTNQMDNDPTHANDVMDDELRVLQARDPYTGLPFATILNLNSHPTVLGSSNHKATGDWPQFANNLMMQDGADFGTQAMTIVGTLGRQQPNRGGCPDPALATKGDSNSDEAICKLTQYAQRVVNRAKVALANAHPVSGKPDVVAKSYFIQDPADNVGILALNDVGDLIGAPIMRANTPPWRTATVVGTVTGTARIGNVLLMSMPGEAYPQIPLAVRSALNGSGIQGFMTAGLSNDQLGYIIAPLPEAYPYVLVRGAQGNDNILFNISQTLGERLTCSLLRGADDVLNKGQTYWQSDPKCPAFANDEVTPEGADVKG